MLSFAVKIAEITTKTTKQYVLLYDEPDLCNDYISKEQGSNDQFSINFPRNCVLGHVLPDIDPLDGVDLWKEVVQPTKKLRSVDLRKSKPIQTTKKTTNNKKARQKSKNPGVLLYRYLRTIEMNHEEPRSESTPNDPPTDPISTPSNIHELRPEDVDSTPQRMTSVTRHPKNRLYINNGASLHILFNKELM